MGTASDRKLPNILITGTPGTGKMLHAYTSAERKLTSPSLVACFPIEAFRKRLLYLICFSGKAPIHTHVWRDSTTILAGQSLTLGSPAVGKSTTCEQLAETLGFSYVNVGECVATQSLHSGWDPKFEAHIIDEDKVSLAALILVHSKEEDQRNAINVDNWPQYCISNLRSVMRWRTSFQQAEQLLIITAVTSSLKGDLHNAMLQIVFYFVLADFLVLLQ